jgi:hypothetical protein
MITTSITMAEWKTFTDGEKHKFFTVERHAKSGEWEPVCYDEYIAGDMKKKGHWKFKICDITEAVYMRHVNTGKMYRWNQSRRISTYEWKLKHG